jgi:hypothetical protein
MRAAPLAELARPARNRSPAITGAEPAVLIVVANGDPADLSPAQGMSPIYVRLPKCATG